MPWGDLRENPASLHFVSDFSSGPLTDWTLFWLLACQCHDLARLLCGDLGRPPWAWDIRESLADGKFFERDCLQANPAHPPTANGIHTDSHFSSNLTVPFSI